MKIKTTIETEAVVCLDEEQQRKVTLQYLLSLCSLKEAANHIRQGYYVSDDSDGTLVFWEDWGSNRGGIVRTEIPDASVEDKNLISVINQIRLASDQ